MPIFTKEESNWAMGLGIVLIFGILFFALKGCADVVDQRNENLCHMRLSLVKTLPDSVRFFQTDTGEVCLDHIK